MEIHLETINMNYLEQYITALDFVMLPEQKTIIVHPDSQFAYLSPAIREDYGLVNTDFRSSSYADLPPIKQIAPSCELEDQECIKTLQVQQYITSQNHLGEIKLYLKQKTPLIDPVQKIAVGVRVDFFPIYSLGHFKPYINSHIAKFDQRINAANDRQLIQLTELEELILFLLILYAKPKTVTLHLNAILGKDVAISTVRNMIHQQLLRKFEVVNTEELIDKAIFLGYDTILPRIMIEQFSIQINIKN